MHNDYSIIKTKLKNIINPNTNIYDIINDTIYRTSELVTHVYQFLRLWLLYEYDKTHKQFKNKEIKLYNFPKITKQTIQICFNVLTMKSSKSAPLGKEGQEIYDIFDNFYEKEYKHLGYLQKINGAYLSAITSYEVLAIKTCIENNIKLNFVKYIHKYVNIYFELDTKLIILKGKDKENKLKEVKSILKQVKNDLVDGTLNSTGIYKDWVIKHRKIILPNKIKYPIIKDINKNCQKYLPYMITISKFCEQKNKYNYQFFPLRSTAISKYCTFDTKALVELFMDSGKMDFFENIDENKKIIWEKYFNMNNKIFKNNNYNFDYTIITNGETVSIRFISREAEMKNNIKKQNRSKGAEILNKIKSIKDENIRTIEMKKYKAEKKIKEKLKKNK